MRILILNGPNLNMLARRESSIYGTRTMEQVMIDLQRTYPDVCFTYLQSNHEGDLIDWLQQYGLPDYLSETAGEPLSGLVLNAGGYTHTSVALRDAVAICTIPVVEVHISDITTREPFRRISLLTDVCAHSVIGHGTDGYREAVEWICSKV